MFSLRQSSPLSRGRPRRGRPSALRAALGHSRQRTRCSRRRRVRRCSRQEMPCCTPGTRRRPAPATYHSTGRARRSWGRSRCARSLASACWAARVPSTTRRRLRERGGPRCPRCRCLRCGGRQQRRRAERPKRRWTVRGRAGVGKSRRESEGVGGSRKESEGIGRTQTEKRLTCTGPRSRSDQRSAAVGAAMAGPVVPPTRGGDACVPPAGLP